MDCIASVRSDMSEFTALFDSWAQKITSDLHQQHTAHQHAVREATEEIDQLRHQHITLTQSHAHITKEYESETSAVARLQTLLASLQKEAQQLPTEVDTLRQRLTAATANEDSQQKLLADTERRCEEEMAAVQKQLLPFQQALGLAFIPKTNELQVVFTRISRMLPSRPFTLSVFVNPANDYEVQTCSPAILTLPALLTELNDAHSGDFAVFLFRVRKEFQRIALSE